jgi:hypothetical protein
MTVKDKAQAKKEAMIKSYAKLARRLRGEVTLNDIKEADIQGLTRDIISREFGSLSNLDLAARSAHPDYFFDVSIESLYTPVAIKDLRDDVEKYSRFVITTAVNGCEVHDGFLASIKNYCRVNDAKLLILVASDPASNLPAHSRKWGTISAKLQNETIVIEDTRLNNNVFVSTIKLSAKHIDPVTGLKRIGQRNGTFMYASPKQRLEPVPVANGKGPHFLMTTGACTVSNYDSDLYMSQRTAYIAEHDHVMGAIVMEIVDDEIYHFRQVQADTKGRFVDLGVEYSYASTRKVRPEAFVLGDWHAGSTDPDARRCWEEVCKQLEPKRLILHDAFDGRSINHHEEDMAIVRALRAERGELSLSDELSLLAKDLEDLAQLTDEVVIVKSNHDQFLEKYLQLGKYVSDPQNHRTALQLALKMLDGNDPLAFGVSKAFKGSTQLWNKISWLRLDDDYTVEGIQCGAHGHLGANGARGSLRAMEAAYGNSVSGHTHTPSILRKAWMVGTSSYLKLEYNHGASSWLHSSCLIYPGGSRQLINCIGGNWRLVK